MNGFCLQSLMTFEELSRDLSSNHTYSTKDDSERKIHFVTLESTSDYDSSNGVLVRFLIDNHFPYLQDFNGSIWFVFKGEWVRTASQYHKETSSFSYYIK